MNTLQRQSNIELVRIIVMLSIVAHHFVVNSGLLELMSPTLNVANDVYLWLFGMWGQVGKNCLVLITGYFMCTIIDMLRINFLEKPMVTMINKVKNQNEL